MRFSSRNDLPIFHVRIAFVQTGPSRRRTSNRRASSPWDRARGKIFASAAFRQQQLFFQSRFFLFQRYARSHWVLLNSGAIVPTQQSQILSKNFAESGNFIGPQLTPNQSDTRQMGRIEVKYETTWTEFLKRSPTYDRYA